MTGARSPRACFVVHGWAHLRAALAAGAESGYAIMALSGPGASAYAGAGWFAQLIRQGRAAFPQVEVTATLDCADRAGDVLAALQCGVTDVVFTGHADALVRLRAIAAGTGAHIHDHRPDALDLINLKDPMRAARLRCGLSP